MQAAPQITDSSSALVERYRQVRECSIALTTSLSAEDCNLQSMPDASPVKWHLAHTSWFFETFILAKWVSGYKPFDASFSYLFNSYYNGVGSMHPRPQRGMLSRPSLDKIFAYRQHVDAAMQAWIASAPEAESLGLLELGLNHEQQHQELIQTDIKHAFSLNPVNSAYRATTAGKSEAAGEQWLAISEGLIEIGHNGAGFAFDNELPRHKHWQIAAEIGCNLVTNGEYLEFIKDAGYSSPLLWASDGWAAVNEHGWQAPLYWDLDLELGSGSEAGSAIALQGEQVCGEELDWHAPVSHISWYEADAYARWAGARLPTEQEWENSAADLNNAFGKVWQWTSSAYSAYPGFQAAPGAVGEYNGKFMCNQFVLRGSSVVTAEGHSRRCYRNFFYPDARWQFSGLRLARDA